ncbi:DUF1515 family protein [Rhizobium sp. ZPR3]|uniref:DUF1515 family protein n=2 Tax=unclassified Rhizobium TaxID=2613769 RepID=A0AAU7SG32_9HYPH
MATSIKTRNVKGNLAAVQEDVSQMRPVTDDVKRWKLMSLGALGMIGIIGMALGVSFVDTLKRIGFCLSANSPASRG